MSDEKRTAESTEVPTETSGQSILPERNDHAYQKVTIVKTEHEVKKGDDALIVVE